MRRGRTRFCSARKTRWSIGLRAFGASWLDHAHEQARVARLFAELVEDVRDARVGEVFVAQDLEREPGREHGLEAHAVRRDRRDLLARERGALVGA